MSNAANTTNRPHRQRVVSSQWEVVVVGAATLTGLILRLYRITAAPLSSQEIYTWDFSHHTVRFIVGPPSLT